MSCGIGKGVLAVDAIKKFAPEIGVLTMMKRGENVFAPIAELGLKTVQLQNWEMELLTTEMAEQIKQDIRSSGITVAAFLAGYSGNMIWNFREGPSTCGLVPRDQRARRVTELKRGAEFAAEIGVPAVLTHCGFIPENPADPLYVETLSAIREVAAYCRDLGLEFWFETGQETPVTLLRVIEDLQLSNLGVNFDTANFTIYGSGNPVDALEILGRYVRNVHLKDGTFPKDGTFLGREANFGTGKVDFPAVFRKLRDLDFDGELIIEREINGDAKIAEIRRTVSCVNDILNEL